MSRVLLRKIRENLTLLLILAVTPSFLSCGTTTFKSATEVITSNPVVLPTVVPKPKTLNFSIERERISYVIIGIITTPQYNYDDTRAKIMDSEGIEATIQALNSMEVYPKDESYQYYGGDSPQARVTFWDEKEEPFASVYFYEDVKLNEIILRTIINKDYKNYKIDSSEVYKLQNICKQYGSWE